MALALGWLCPQGGFSLGQGGLGWLRLRVGLGSGLASASGRLGFGLGLALGLGILLGWLKEDILTLNTCLDNIFFRVLFLFLTLPKS